MSDNGREREECFMKRTAVTVVEILIVLILVGISAAVIVPHTRFKELTSDLRSIRANLELYRVAHDAYPNGVTDTLWVAQLTGRTDKDGTLNESGAYGPYISTFPVNPFNGNGQVLLDDGSHDPGEIFTGVGWYFNTSTGRFAPNDSRDHGRL